MQIQAYWELKDGSFVSWERLLQEPELQEQLVDKAAFRGTVTKVDGRDLPAA